MKKFLNHKYILILSILMVSSILWSFHDSAAVAKKYKYSKSQRYQAVSGSNSLVNLFTNLKKDKVQFSISTSSLTRKYNGVEKNYEIVSVDVNKGNCEKAKGNTYTLKSSNQQLFFLTIDPDGNDALWFDSEEGLYHRYVK
jgi:hypothetical protein